uniref:Uncharacterized protein n=1 Tax=Chlorella vulgaris TaxID=3077 RepID=V9H158_CHLVU|nr:hypothetical protein ChvulCp142 [Chlorella vulgaris]pir/T07328/ hypothetical protein 60c - Chlorella vulgaris chloroplast [Chlorella vulgaris]BAA57976.1 unnamed protein product [Chlorella vulgaris]
MKKKEFLFILFFYKKKALGLLKKMHSIFFKGGTRFCFLSFSFFFFFEKKKRKTIRTKKLD